MLGEKMKKHDVNVWFVNTGWSGGEYGIGERISLKYTTSMITAALKGQLNDLEYETHSVFGLHMPTTCPNVPSEILNPRNTWKNKEAYDQKADDLAKSFNENFEQFSNYANQEILSAKPNVQVKK